MAELAGVSIKSRPQRLQQCVRRLHSTAQPQRTVDSISLQAPTTQATEPNLRMIQVAPIVEPLAIRHDAKQAVPSRAESNDVSPARTKAENRMLRKLKRIQHGSHNKHGSDSDKLVGQVQEMLKKIEESPQVLGALVSAKKEDDPKSSKEKERSHKRGSELKKGRWINGKWVRGRQETFKGKPTKAGVEANKGPSFKARKENIKENIANQRAGEETVEVGDEASWEHVQDEWTEEPEWIPDEPAKTEKTTRKGKGSGKQSDAEDASSEDTPPPKPQEPWGIQKSALERKFGEKGWQPRKRLSPDTLSGIRALHASNPTVYNVDMLREHFKITPEAIRRILKSKWRPSTEEIEDRMQRWEKRGVKKWTEMAEQGQKPPKKWRVLGVPNPKLGQRKTWDSNSGVARKGKREGNVVKEEGLAAKSRQMEQAQRTRFKESLAGRIL